MRRNFHKLDKGSLNRHMSYMRSERDKEMNKSKIKPITKKGLWTLIANWPH